MKTTTILITSGALLIALAASLNLYRSAGPDTVAEVNSTVEIPREVSRSMLLPVKDTHISVLLPGELMAYMPDSTEEQMTLMPGGHEIIPVSEIVFLEAEEKVDLGFDVNEYLPADFQAVAKGATPLSEIEYLEAEDSTELGFDTANYLPDGFDPYATRVSGPQDISFMEETSAIELGFDVNEYLPADFDPYEAVALSSVPAWATGPLAVCILLD